MAVFKDKNTIVWIIVGLVLLLLVFRMNKSENMTDCQTCGGCQNCSACTYHYPLLDNAYDQKVENFVNTVNNMQPKMNKNMNDKMYKEMNDKKPSLNLPGYTNNVNHMNAALLYENMPRENMEQRYIQPRYMHNPYVSESRLVPHEGRGYHMEEMKEMLRKLMNNMPMILNKCTPDVLKTLMNIGELVNSTDGKVCKLREVEPVLTTEFNNLNKLLENLDKKNLQCLETETHVPLTNMLCTGLNNMDTYELNKHVEFLEYVNEMLRSQKYNFRKLRDLHLERMRDLVNTCDMNDPEKRTLQLRLLSLVSHILHNVGYIFQDDTVEQQQRVR